MKTSLLLRVFVVLLAFVALGRADDKVVAVDLNAGMLTVQQQNSLKTFRIKPFTDISINGVKGTASQLKPGMEVTVTLSDPQTATKVAARGNTGTVTPGTPAPSKFAGFASTQLTHRIVLKALVDARDHYTIQDGKLRIEHFEFKKPIDITINGVKWEPNWTGDTTDEFTAFNPPLAPFAGANLTIKKLKGRGSVTILEPPTEANGYKLVFRLKDEGAGPDEHEVRLNW